MNDCVIQQGSQVNKKQSVFNMSMISSGNGYRAIK